jgi:hypothetical protein
VAHLHFLLFYLLWVGDALVFGQGTLNFFILLFVSNIKIQERTIIFILH